jgi:hypothetical protein
MTIARTDFFILLLKTATSTESREDGNAGRPAVSPVIALRLKSIAEPYFRVNDGSFARDIEHAVGVYNTEVAMPCERIQMALRKPVAGSANVTLQRLSSIERGMWKNGNLGVSVKQVFTSFVVIEAGHHQHHSVRQVNVMGADGGMKKLRH